MRPEKRHGYCILDDRVKKRHQQQGEEHIPGRDLAGFHLTGDDATPKGEPHDNPQHRDGDGAFPDAYQF